ncbi:YajQ family cyclic di-GMP-binding protein [Porticoccaceae bacterium]|nr:YajQ family cyclic di-GMP-binding protein [Porticoccaceae bacterium]MDB2634636.1 YajQ family cyclic di-GMP-binding protein [Porticoccaceae bacterium]MDB2664655.1 YajQ family cyclic di-GMP-binding protein [Porticoccaceae bacterium]
MLNATNNAARELTTRFDFRGVEASISLENEVVILKAEADFQCQQLLDIFAAQLVKRKIDPRVMEYDQEALHSGKTFSLHVAFKQGISSDVSKKMVKLIKAEKLQAQVQGDEVRVSGKKRDDLQAVMALIRAADLGQPFQFKNFRD